MTGPGVFEMGAAHLAYLSRLLNQRSPAYPIFGLNVSRTLWNCVTSLICEQITASLGGLPTWTDRLGKVTDGDQTRPFETLASTILLVAPGQL